MVRRIIQVVLVCGLIWCFGSTEARANRRQSISSNLCEDAGTDCRQLILCSEFMGICRFGVPGCDPNLCICDDGSGNCQQ